MSGDSKIRGYVNSRFIKNKWNGKRVFFLGDSITLQERWPTTYNSIMKTSSFVNVAVSGARMCDYVDSVYDGNPVFNGADNNHNNVIGNQVKKIIDNDYPAPDIIFISAGTNDVGVTTDVTTVEAQFTSAGAYVALADANRRVYPGAVRYAVETLQIKYPNAQVFLCMPIQAAVAVKAYADGNTKTNMLIACAGRLSIPVIRTDLCGIYGAYEVSGAEGKYLSDGLHPNALGAQLQGKYVATEVAKWYMVR